VLAVISPIYVLFDWASVFSGASYKEILDGVKLEYSGILGLLLGFFLAEQLLHYYCDRCLFRFRDPGVRKAVAMGIEPEAIAQIVALCAGTLGMPSTVAVHTWVSAVLDKTQP